MEETAPAPADWPEALERARACSPFLARSLERLETLVPMLKGGEGEAALRWAKGRGDPDDIDTALRHQRIALATTLAIGDLAGAFPLRRVFTELTDFADRALDTAIRTAIAERTGIAQPDGFIGLALGKQGAGELNYSSDIDPIFLYDPETLPRRERDDPGEVAQRYARRIVRLLSENTRAGYVLRVDLRLRPASEVSPLAVPVAAARAHYHGDALAWERAAFIRARAAAGDIAGGRAFLDAVDAFIWRTARDFGAVEALAALTERIRKNDAGPERPGPGFDIKRGRGGIREIEFFAQTHQLVHGGREPSLRVRGTRAALDALTDAGHLTAATATTLGTSYDRLRTVEHRIQMMHDRQIHILPEGEALDDLARLDGSPSAAALIAELQDITQAVEAIHDELVGRERTVAPVPQSSDRSAYLESLGFADGAALARRIEGWRSGRFTAVQSEAALAALDKALPDLLAAIAASDDKQRALARWESILDRAPSALKLLQLVAARPDVLERLVNALTLSPLLADALARQPSRLDVLLDRKPLAPPLAVGEIAERMRAGAMRGDYEAQLDTIRRETGDARFVLGLRLIEEDNPPLAIARVLANLAEAATQVALEAARAEFAKAHGTIAGSELLVLGLGRLGGGVLTHASDLDIIYLFTGDFTAQSDGDRPLGATLYFNRLASRVTAALSVPTAHGALYEIDTRLRPQGNQGPLAVSLEAFDKYQREAAWTWEHMALTRARPIAGSRAARAAVERIIRAVVRMPRDPVTLRRDVLSMRRDMARHKPARGVLDVKLQRGGLVDLEFLVHFLQLRDAQRLSEMASGALAPDLGEAIGALVAAGLLPEKCVEAHELMTAMLVAGRLLAPGGKSPPRAAAKALARACGRDSLARLQSDLAAARQTVARAWEQVFSTKLEEF
jgi:glutamate-ammonia-ligase adenylyltransferase